MTLVSNNIKVLRKKYNYTQETLAEATGIKRPSIGSYEEGRAIPPANNLIKIAKVFGVSLDQLLHQEFKEDEVLAEELPNQKTTESQSDSVNPFFFSDLFSQEKDPETPKTKSDKFAIRYIKSILFGDYIRDSGKLLYSEGLPVLELPFFDNKAYTAFDAPTDFLIENSILICDKITDFKNLTDGQNYLVITKTYGFMYRRLYNQTHIKGTWLCSSDKNGIKSLELPAYDVLEIWKINGYFSKSLPMPEVSLESLKSKISELKTEIDLITNFRSI